MKLFSKNEEKRLPEPELKRIPIANIEFAPYQRELKPSKVNKIVKDFIPDIVGIGLVSFRGGKFWGLDAQHRIEAMKKLGYKEMLCQVLTGLTYEEECLRFNVLNTGRTQLTANQIFHCRVEGRDANAMELVAAFDKYRFSYNKSNSTKYDNVIGAVSKFVRLQKTYGIDMVERVLKVLRCTWYGDRDSLSSAIISGLGTFFSENIDADDNVLCSALEKIMPEKLVAEANIYVKGSMLRPGRADNACYHVAKIIAQLYDEEVNKPKKGRPRKAVV